MSTRRVSVVFFDAAGTLIRLHGSVGAQYAALARQVGVDADPRALDALFPVVFRAAPPMAFPGAAPDTIPALERGLWRDLVRDLVERAGLWPALGAARFRVYFDALYAHFETTAAWETYPDALPALRAVRAAGCRTGLLSNFDGRVIPLLERLGLAGWLDSLTLSSRVGAAKPAPMIFAAALARHGVSPDDALHIGDSPRDDLAGALAAGLRAVLVDRGGRHREVPAESRVTSLTDVSRFL